MVERWLLQVEEMMVASVRKVLGESYSAYGETARNMWVLEWPGQMVICTSSIYWTAEVSDAMKKPGGVEVSTVTATRETRGRSPRAALSVRRHFS